MPDEMHESRCIVCSQLIEASNNSKEHIIPEAIGGRFKVKNFICRTCNNNAGQTWDAELAIQLRPLSLLFGVQRQRGRTPGLPITTTAGEELTIFPDGRLVPTKPTYRKKVTTEKVKISFTARTRTEAKRFLTEIKQDYPNIDIEQIASDLKPMTKYPDGIIHHKIEFGGKLSGRSIVKSALALAHHAGLPSHFCADALRYLRDDTAFPCFGYYYTTDLINNRPPEAPLHCISIEANPNSGLILGYAEYFGVQRIVLCLGKKYSGEHIQICHSIDPRTGAQLNISTSLKFSEEGIKAIYSYQHVPEAGIKAAFEKVLPAALMRQFEVEKERVIKEATEYAFANCGAHPGDILTEEQIKKLSYLVAEKLKPFLLNHLRYSYVPPFTS